MRVASKIGLGAGLLVALMVLALGYEVHLIRRLERINSNLSQAIFSVSQSSLELETLLNSLESDIRYLLVEVTVASLVKPDPKSQDLEPQEPQKSESGFLGGVLDTDFLDKIAGTEMLIKEEIRSINSVVRSDQERAAMADLDTQWASYLRVRAFDLEALVAFTPEEIAGLRALILERISLVQEARANLELATQGQHDTLIGRADKASRQAMTASWSVIAAAGVISLFVLGLTVRAINEPLNRLVEGTRAVAEGRFFYQIDLPGNDEFSVMATSFNEMVHRLGAIDKMKREFLSHVSHELRTPLVAMQETSELLLDELPGPLNEKQRRLISLSLNGSKRLSAMISKLLDLSRIEAGALEYDLKRHDLVEVANTATGEFEARARDHALVLHLVLPEKAIFARCDRDRIIQVVENLLENAIKFSPPDETIEVEVKSTKRRNIPAGLLGKAGLRAIGERPTLFTVSDAGPGVPPESRDKIFEKFRQLQRGKSSETGVGLGLAICREIVQAHGGAIWVDDSDKGGSSFHVALPAARTAARKKGHGEKTHAVSA